MKKYALILSGIAWNTTIQRHHSISFALSKMGYEVFFVESIPSSKFTFKKLINKINKNKNKIKSTINIDKDGINVINQGFVNPIGGLFEIVNSFKIKQLLKNLNFKFDVVINYLPISTTLHIVEKINTDKIIYDCVRDFENWGGYPSNIQQIENKIISLSDFILVDSYYLKYKITNRYSESQVVQILPIVDKEIIPILSKSILSSEIKNILYFGSIGSHINVEILNKLANDGYKIHIVGEIYQGIKLNKDIIHHGFVSNLLEMSKIIIQNADAIIIPYKGNMDGVIPAKLMQCITTGLPIFINEFYDSNILNEYMYVYKDYEDLKSLIKSYNIDEHKKIRKNMMDFSLENSNKDLFSRLKLILNHK